MGSSNTKRRIRLGSTAAAMAFALTVPLRAQTLTEELRRSIAERASALEPKLIAWRRDFHAHPELGNRETRTAGIVAEHLKKLGLQVRTGVARTGVVAVLQGGAPGPVVALRADMDALPVKESAALPFASRQKGVYRGQQVDVMHACGHDGHTAILMIAAEILAGMRKKLPGTVVFYFQPAEEGPSDFVPDGKNFWGARQMIREGAMKSPRPDAVFGLHLWSKLRAGELAYRAGALMASSDDLRIAVIGKQTHAGSPWDGVDPIVASAQVLLGLQTIVSRSINHAVSPTVVSIGTIHGGSRYNIVPERVDMEGTVRTYDAAVRATTHALIERTVTNTAAASGARAELTVLEKYDVTVNDPALTARMVPSLEWAAPGAVSMSPLSSASEDFSFMAKEAPGFFFFVGAAPRGKDPKTTAPNHSPDFEIDEAALSVGVRAITALATDFLTAKRP